MHSRRDRLLLVLLLVGQFVLVSSQADRSSGTLLESLLLRGVAPVAGVVAAGDRAVSSVPERLATRGALREENRRLREELAAARGAVAEVVRLEGEVRRLASALDFRVFTGLDADVADVVYSDPDSWLRTMIVRAAPAARLKANQPVIAVDGVVGRVVAVAGPWAKIQLITDRAAAVGAQLARTRQRGVVRGAGGGRLALEYLSRQADAEIGDVIQTAGIDGVYPRGLVVGRIARIGSGGDLFHEIEILPAVDFGALDQVLVLDPVEIPASLGDSPPGQDEP